MLTKRIIACLDVRDGQVVKGVQFQQLRHAGDPGELATVTAHVDDAPEGVSGEWGVGNGGARFARRPLLPIPHSRFPAFKRYNPRASIPPRFPQ